MNTVLGPHGEENLYIVNMGGIKFTAHVKNFDFNDLPKQNITFLIIKMRSHDQNDIIPLFSSNL
jgi:hypothetical protein